MGESTPISEEERLCRVHDGIGYATDEEYARMDEAVVQMFEAATLLRKVIIGLERDRERLCWALRCAEWSGRDICPACGNDQQTGHALNPPCVLRRALARCEFTPTTQETPR